MMFRLLAGLIFSLALLSTPALSCGGPPAKTCTSESQNVNQWTVHDFDYHEVHIFTNAAHQHTYAIVNFTLENPALDYRPNCYARSKQLTNFFYGNFPHHCFDVPDGDDAIFTYSAITNELRLNQTWHCPESGSGFNAVGNHTMDLNCTETYWKNPDYYDDDGVYEFYSTDYVNCDFVTVPVHMDEVDEVN